MKLDGIHFPFVSSWLFFSCYWLSHRSHCPSVHRISLMNLRPFLLPSPWREGTLFFLKQERKYFYFIRSYFTCFDSHFSSVQSLSHVRLFVTEWWQHARPPCPSQLLEPTQTHVHQVSDAIQSSHLLSFPSSPAFTLSQHQGLLKQVLLWIRWPKYWSYSFSISPFNEYSGLISFRMDWLDLLAVQGILKSLLQHHNSKASIHRHNSSASFLAFFTVQVSHPYMATGKDVDLTRWTIVGKVMSLLFNML